MAPRALGSDVLIVGAGPAGSAAAITLARAGAEVILIDKAHFPRPKCCGDGLTTGCLRQLDALGFDPETIPSWKPIEDINLVSPHGKLTTFDLPQGRGQYAAVARRSELDSALVDLARLAGATVIEGCSISGLSQDANQIIATTSGEGAPNAAIVSQWLIAADGMWSPTRKLLGHEIGGYRGDWHAFRQYFTSVGDLARSELVCWFEPDLLPGYVWSFPTGDGSANVGFGIVRGGQVEVGDMKHLWPQILARPHIAEFLGPDATGEDRHTAWPIPTSLGQFPLTDNRVLFVGDAAMACDPMSGEGIGQAIETGTLAADILGSQGVEADPTAVADLYRGTLKRGMQRDHSVASMTGKLLANRHATEACLRVAASTGWTRRNFARWLFEDYPRAAVGNPRRWGWGTFTTPGAYQN